MFVTQLPLLDMEELHQWIGLKIQSMILHSGILPGTAEDIPDWECPECGVGKG